MTRIVSILGSTGSIGLTSLKIIDKKKITLGFTYYQQIKITKLLRNKLKNTNLNIL